MMNNYSSTTIKEGVETPHAHDVLCGRGGYANSHEGNRNWRRLVQANKDLYAALPKFKKQLLSQSIVNAVQAQSPPGRFLCKDVRRNLWFPIDEAKAVDKTSQALREGGKQNQEQDEDKNKSDNEPEVVKVKPPPIQLPPIHLAMTGDQMPTSIDIYMPSTDDEAKVPKNAKVQPAPNPPVTSHARQQQHGNIAYGYGGEQQGMQYPQQQQYHPSMPNQGMGQPQQQMGMEPYYVPVPHSVLSQQPPMQPSLYHEQQAASVPSHQPTLMMPLMYPDGDPRISEIIAAAIAATQATSSANDYAPYVSGSLNQAMDIRTNITAASPPPNDYSSAQPMKTASSNVDSYCSTTTYASSSNTAASYSIASGSSAGTSSAIPASANIPAYSVASVGDAETAANTTNEATINSDYDYFPSMPDALEKPETSLGSMMSCTPLPPDFQTSFGSMSLGDDSLKKFLLPFAKIDKSAPTLTKHKRSKADLLDSDDDEDTDDDGKEHEVTSADWEKMRAVFGITDRDMPKEIGHYGTSTSIVDLARDISGMSTLSMADFSLDRSPSSMMMRDITIGSVTSPTKESSVTNGSDSKGDHSNLSEREKLEKMLLDRGASLAFEEFGTKS